MKRNSMKKFLRKNSMNLFYVPALALMLFFIAFPLFNGLRLSFYSWNGYSQNMRFVGIDNYVDMLSDRSMKTVFLNTLLYGFGSTILQNVLGLVTALLVDSRFKGHTVVRTFIYLPIMISGLIMGYIMYYFLQYDGGILNEILGWFGKEPVDWLADSGRARIIILLVNSVQYYGNAMVLYLAGLQSIPELYYEAAKVDGASAFQRFRYVTMPLLIPAITSAVIVNLIGSLKLNDVIVSLTNGGPGHSTHSLSTFITLNYFRLEKAGYASAIGVFMFAFIMLVSTVTNRYFRKKEVEY